MRPTSTAKKELSDNLAKITDGFSSGKNQKIIRLPEVINRTGISRSQIYLMVSRGEFPAPVKLGRRSVGWFESSIDLWIGQLLSDGRTKELAN